MELRYSSFKAGLKIIVKGSEDILTESFHEFFNVIVSCQIGAKTLSIATLSIMT
jgi:hypothetical protein